MTDGGKPGAKATLLTVRVHASSRQARVEQLGPLDYKVHVTAPPEKGKANREVIEALAGHLGLPVSRFRLVRGAASRTKLVAVDSPDNS